MYAAFKVLLGPVPPEFKGSEVFYCPEENRLEFATGGDVLYVPISATGLNLTIIEDSVWQQMRQNALLPSPTPNPSHDPAVTISPDLMAEVLVSAIRKAQR